MMCGFNVTLSLAYCSTHCMYKIGQGYELISFRGGRIQNLPTKEAPLELGYHLVPPSWVELGTNRAI